MCGIDLEVIRLSTRCVRGELVGVVSADIIVAIIQLLLL